MHRREVGPSAQRGWGGEGVEVHTGHHGGSYFVSTAPVELHPRQNHLPVCKPVFHESDGLLMVYLRDLLTMYKQP